MAAQVTVGAFGGLDNSDLSGDGPPLARYKHRAGFVAGVAVDVYFANDVALSVQPSYVQRGTVVAFELPGEDEPRDSLDLRIDYLSVPVLIKIVAGHRRTFFTGGLDLSYRTGAQIDDGGPGEDVSDVLRPFDVLAVLGFGVSVLKQKPEVTLELRYTQSIVNVANFESDPEAISLPVRFRSTGLQLLAGIGFTLSK